jgi:hypothetical protein
VDLATTMGMSLVGFLRDPSMVVYSGAHRVGAPSAVDGSHHDGLHQNGPHTDGHHQKGSRTDGSHQEGTDHEARRTA